MTSYPPRARRIKSALRFDAGASKLGDIAAQDVRFNLVAIDSSPRITGLEILCAAPQPCRAPETCFHVRAALHKRADAPAIARLLLTSHGVAPSLKVRIPLADRLWATAQIPLTLLYPDRPPADCKATISYYTTTYSYCTFEYGNHGIDDLKWAFANYAASRLDRWRFKDSVTKYGDVEYIMRCPQCERQWTPTIAGEPDFAWALTWAFDGNPCYDCVRSRARVQYNARSTLEFTTTPDQAEW